MVKSNITEDIKGIALISVRRSKVNMRNWNNTKKHLTSLLQEKGLNAYLIISIFGKDEIWVVGSYTSLEDVLQLENEENVMYIATLSQSLPLNEKTMKKIINKRLPVGYVLFRNRLITLEQIGNQIENLGGLPFLIGSVNHPKGFSHCFILTVDTGDVGRLSEVVYSIMQSLQCKDWECILGVKHGWSKARKDEVTSEIEEIIQDWMEAATKGKLTDWELIEIERRFGIQLSLLKKQKS